MPSKGYLIFSCLVILLNYASAETGKGFREKWLGEAEYLLQATIVNTIQKAASPSINSV